MRRTRFFWNLPTVGIPVRSVAGQQPQVTDIHSGMEKEEERKAKKGSKTDPKQAAVRTHAVEDGGLTPKEEEAKRINEQEEKEYSDFRRQAEKFKAAAVSSGSKKEEQKPTTTPIGQRWWFPIVCVGVIVGMWSPEVLRLNKSYYASAKEQE